MIHYNEIKHDKFTKHISILSEMIAISQNGSQILAPAEWFDIALFKKLILGVKQNGFQFAVSAMEDGRIFVYRMPDCFDSNIYYQTVGIENLIISPEEALEVIRNSCTDYIDRDIESARIYWKSLTFKIKSSQVIARRWLQARTSSNPIIKNFGFQKAIDLAISSGLLSHASKADFETQSEIFHINTGEPEQEKTAAPTPSAWDVKPLDGQAPPWQMGQP